MTVLYHAPLSCSLAARFVAAEGDVELDIEPLNLMTKEIASGGSLYDINPLGQVSVLQLPDGSRLTETSTILVWLQTQSQIDEFHIAPDTADYFQMLRWIAFCATELHKGLFRVVFYQEATEEVKDRVRQLAPLRLQVLDDHLHSRSYLVGDSFSAADAYLAWFFVLSGAAQVDHTDYPALEAYRQRVMDRPAIHSLIEADTLLDSDLKQHLLGV
ncbi:MAG: glutathione binding-like protein [Pseudomonadota bacterium]